VRIYPARLEVRYAGADVATVDRLGGHGQAAIDYRHLIGSLIRKPGAFARYRYQARLFPTTTFRRAYDALAPRHGSRADVEYVRVLYLATRTSECEVEATLGRLLEGGTLRDATQVKALVQPDVIIVPTCTLTPPDLSVYDACLEAAGGGL
jgi:hypothetical protein